MSLLRKLLVLVAFVGLTARAEAIPVLQLDIVGGTYNGTSEDTVATTGTFTLVALLTPGPNDDIAALLADTYYVSAALSPATAVGGSLGSFNFAGTPVSVTSDMTFGTPPLDLTTAISDPGDLQTHSVFPTYLSQFSFQFVAANRVTSYDVQTTPGDPVVNPTGGTYYANFVVTASLTGTNALHFDLYDTLLARCGTGNPATRPPCTPEDIDAGLNAPFSHDASSGPNTPEFPDTNVPEPASFLLISLGALGAAAGLRRRRA